MSKKIKIVLVGAGNRADVYSSYSLEAPDKMEIVGIVDPDPVRRGIMAKKYSVSEENLFSDVEEFVKRDKFADAVINATMDHLHIKTSIPVLKKGYDLLLEKPFALNIEEVEELSVAAKKYDRKVIICHVLRYAPFYKAIKERILNGEIGKVVSVEMCEHVNYHHMAVSFVRGKWRSEKLCFAPMILAKCCHDIDILMWMLKETTPVAVSSFGNEMQFGTQNKPEGAGSRCMVDCPMAEECHFSAQSNYLSNPRWLQYVWKCIENEGEVSAERKAESMRVDNPYGKCVWDFERDSNVDHQTVNVEFANGAIGSFMLMGGSAKSERNIHIVGTKGEIKGTFEDSKYVVRHMTPNEPSGYSEELYDLKITGDMTGERGAHGGGDRNLVIDFLDYLNDGNPSISCTTLDDSKMSHVVVYTAEKARKNRTVEPIPEVK